MRRVCSQRGPQRSAFSLAETFVSILLVGVSLAASMQTVGAVLRQRSSTNDETVAALLGQQLLSEILAHAYEEEGSAVFGPETGEDERANFDDVDDYDNWTETPPQDLSGTTLDGLSGWSREVNVEQVGTSDALVADISLGGLSIGVGLRTSNGSDSGIKRVTVTVKKNGAAVSSLVGVRTDAWPGTE